MRERGWRTEHQLSSGLTASFHSNTIQGNTTQTAGSAIPAESSLSGVPHFLRYTSASPEAGED